MTFTPKLTGAPENASDGAAVKGAASAVREAQAEGPTLTGATPMRPSWRVREGSLNPRLATCIVGPPVSV
jgi:hypothetical protein